MMSPFPHPTQSFPSPTVQSHTTLSVSMLILSHTFPLTSKMNTLLFLKWQSKNLDTPSDDIPHKDCNPAGQVTMVPGLDSPSPCTTSFRSPYLTRILLPSTDVSRGFSSPTPTGFPSVAVTVSSVTLTKLTLPLVLSHTHSLYGDSTPTLRHTPTQVRVDSTVSLLFFQLTTDTPWEYKRGIYSCCLWPSTRAFNPPPGILTKCSGTSSWSSRTSYMHR